MYYYYMSITCVDDIVDVDQALYTLNSMCQDIVQVMHDSCSKIYESERTKYKGKHKENTGGTKTVPSLMIDNVSGLVYGK